MPKKTPKKSESKFSQFLELSTSRQKKQIPKNLLSQKSSNIKDIKKSLSEKVESDKKKFGKFIRALDQIYNKEHKK